MRIAYLVSRFPKITETFVLYEMIALEELGAQIELCPLIRQREVVVHPDAAPFLERAHFARFFSAAVVKSQLYWLTHSPRKYLRLWKMAIWESRRSLKFLFRSIGAVLLGANFARMMMDNKVEHVHAHFATHAALAALTIHKLTGIPFSFTAHAHDIFVEHALLEHKIKAASFIVSISEHNRTYLKRLYGGLEIEKVHVVRCGVDRSIFRPPDPRPENETFTILCVAGLEEKKGHRYLIEACRLLVDQDVAFRCLLIGGGPLLRQIEAQIMEYTLKEKVVLLGQQTREQVQRYLAQSDLFVLPSVRLPSGKQEGIPVALMEAMAMSLPVIATRLSGIPELVEDGKTGLLVPERDPEAIAEAIQKLAGSQSLRRTIGTAAYEKIVNEYDLQKNASQLYGLMRRYRRSIVELEHPQLSANNVVEGIQ